MKREFLFLEYCRKNLRILHTLRRNFLSFQDKSSSLPNIAMRYIKHHDSNIFILIVSLLALIQELSLDSDQTIKSLIGDQSSVSGVQLDQESWVTSVDHCFILTCS